MSVSRYNRSKFKSLVRKIQQWMYSWMKPKYVEDDDEYKISKFLLIQFVCSGAVLNAVDSKLHIVLSILQFIRGHVFVHEGLYLYYLRKKVRHMYVAQGSQHEVSVYLNI